KPDFVLIDAGRGFNAIGASAVLDQADLGMICVSPLNKNFENLKWVVQAASKQRRYKGIPDLRFLITSMPSVAHSEQQFWVAKAEEWIAENWQPSRSDLLDDLSYQIPYSPDLAKLTNLAGQMQPEMLEPYRPVANAIARYAHGPTHFFNSTFRASDAPQNFL